MNKKIDTSTFGVVVIDMQPKFLNRFDKKEQERLISNHEEFLEECYKKNILVSLLEYKNCGKTDKRILEPIKRKYKENIFIKEDNGGYKGSREFKNFIEKSELQNILYTGINANSCLLSTAIEGKNYATPIFCEELSNSNYGNARKTFGVHSATDWFWKNGRLFNKYNSLLDILK